MQTQAMFRFENFASPLVLKAAVIVERMFDDKEFFASTYGVVLNEVGKHYHMPSLTRQDLEKIRGQLVPLRLVRGHPYRDDLYMTCFTKTREIHIEPAVSASDAVTFIFLLR